MVVITDECMIICDKINFYDSVDFSDSDLDG